MLCRKISGDYQSMIGWGQICLAAGLLLSIIGTGRYPTELLQGLLGSGSLFDFMQGFAAGVSSVLFGLSIVLNIRGLTMYRAAGQSSKGKPPAASDDEDTSARSPSGT